MNTKTDNFLRQLKSRMEITMKDTPVVLINGPRQSGKLTNFTQIGRQLNLDTKTAQKYVGLLETLFLVHQLRPWHGNTLSSIVKTPKIHFIDSGLLACLNRVAIESIEKDKSSFLD